MRKNLWEQHKKSEWNAFDTYLVTILLKNIVGGKPATADVIAKWIDATCKKKKDEERQKIKDAHVETLGELTDEKASKQMCVFARLDGELCIEGRQVKAMLKEGGNIIKKIAPGEPIGMLRSKVADQVFVVEDYISLGRAEPDEVIDRVIHVMTAQGPRDSIKRVEIVNSCKVTFTLKRRKGSGKDSVPEKVLLGIRLREGVDVGVLSDSERARADVAVADGLLDALGERLVLTARGRLLADAVVRDVLDD